MQRKIICAVIVLLFGVASLQAATIRGNVKSVNADTSTLTLTVDDKDQIVSVAKDAKIQHSVGKKAKKAQLQDLPGGLGALPVGKEVTVTTETKDGKEVATQITLVGLDSQKKSK